MQWQCLYGSLDGEWMVVNGPGGLIRPDKIGDLEYLGEPSELLTEMARFRAARARNGTAAHTRAQLANELGIDSSTMDAVMRGAELRLSSGGWSTMVQTVLLMRAEVI